MGQRETPIEDFLRQEVKKAGGVVEKFKSPQKNNVPDDIVSWPAGVLDFVEVKAFNEEPNEAQKRDHARRRKMGHSVYVIDSELGVLMYVAEALQRVRDKLWRRTLTE